MFHRPRSRLYHDRETTQLICGLQTPEEILYLIFSYVDQSTLYRSLSLVSVCFHKIAYHMATKKNDSLHECLQTFFHRLYQYIFSSVRPNKHVLKQVTALQKRLFVFASESKINSYNDLWLLEKIDTMRGLICEKFLRDINKHEKKHRFFKFLSSAGSAEKIELNTRTDFIVINWLLNMPATRNTNGLLFCIQHELSNAPKLDNVYRELLETTRDAIISTIEEEQLAHYFTSAHLEAFAESLDYMNWCNQLVYTASEHGDYDERAQEAVKNTMSTVTGIFAKLHSLFEEKRQKKLIHPDLN